MIRKVVVAAILGILMTGSGAMAQEGRWQEIGVQGTGFLTKDSSGNGINQHATDTAGFLVSYRYHSIAGWPRMQVTATPETRSRLSVPRVRPACKPMCTKLRVHS